MALSLFDELAARIPARINRVNPGASINRTSADRGLDWFAASIRAARENAAQREELERRRREEALAARRAQERLQAKKPRGLGGKLRSMGGSALDAVGDNLGDAFGAAKGQAGWLGGEVASGAKAAWGKAGEEGQAAKGALPGTFGKMVYDYDADGNIAGAHYEYSLGSVAHGPKKFFDQDELRKEADMLRKAGYLTGSGQPSAYEIMQARGKAFDRSNLPGGVKFAVGMGVDPLTWAPVGGAEKLIGKGAQIAGKAALGDDALKALSASRKAGLGLKALHGVGKAADFAFGGFDDARIAAGAIGGMALGAQAGETFDLPDWARTASIVGGGAVGGGAAGFRRGGSKAAEKDAMAVVSPRSAPTNRPIVPDSAQRLVDMEEIPGHPGKFYVKHNGETLGFTSPGPGIGEVYWTPSNGGGRIYTVRVSSTEEFADKIGAPKSTPRPMANERMWFHSTHGDHELLDPEFGVGNATGITQGPGIYLAADPEKSAGRYGDRTFATEFDGNTLDLTAKADTGYWHSLAQKIGLNADEAFSEPALQRARSSAYSTIARKSGGDLNYTYRDALQNAVERTLAAQPASPEELGRFQRILSTDMAHGRREKAIAMGIVQNAIADSGFDAVFHHSPQADGEVLIVLNGDKLRTVGEVQNAAALYKGSPSWESMKGAISEIPSRAEVSWNNYQDGAVQLHIDGQKSTVIYRDPDGLWRPKGPGFSEEDAFTHVEDAKEYVLYTAEQQGKLSFTKPSFKQFDALGNISEQGAIDPRLAAMLGTTALGGGIGYAMGGPEGALAGAALGFGASALPIAAQQGLSNLRNAPVSQLPGYGPGIAGTQIPNIPKSSPLNKFTINSQVRSQAGRILGRVVGVDETGTVLIKDKAGNVKPYPSSHLYTDGDFSFVNNQRRLQAAQKKAMASQPLIDQSRADFEDFLRHADELTATNHVAGRLTGKLGRAIDPAARFVTDAEKKTHAIVTAGANYIHRGDTMAGVNAKKYLDALAPLLGEGGTADLRRAIVQATAGAIPATAGIALSELTGNPAFTELGVLGGVGAAGFVSAKQRGGFMRDTPWENIPPRDPDLLTGRIQNPKSQDRLIDILQFWDGPEGYAIETLPPQQQVELQQAKAAFDQLDMAGIKATNAALQAAGMDPLPYREDRGVLHAFTEDSLKKSGIKNDHASPVDVRTTSFRKEQSIEQRRELGETLREAYAKAPELKLKGGFAELLTQQLREQERIKASAMQTDAFIKNGLARRVPSELQQMTMSPADLAKAKAQTRALNVAGWKMIPGVEDVYFDPEVVDTLKSLMTNTSGSENAVMNFLDAATNQARVALFVGDLTAFTMQGAMAAIQNPVGTIRNFFPLVGATAFGEKYADWFKARHPEMVTRAAAGGSRSFEHGGLERELGLGRLNLAEAPGIRNIEGRSRAFLDVYRLLMHDNITKQEALLKGVGAMAPRGLRGAATKLATGDVGHAALEAVRLGGPVAAGAAIVSDNPIDVPFLNDDMDKLFTAALGITAGVGGDMAISRAGEGVMSMAAKDGLRSDLEVASGAMAGKSTNRISGTTNRQVQGISNRQAQIERVFFMRSPALTRNALTLAKLAASDAGPEGAFARVYLVKTAILVGSAMAFVHAAKEGRLPEPEDFNPENPQSPFAPGNLGRADLGRAGEVTPSNPLMSLMRAFLHNEHPAGESAWHMPDASEVGVGLAGWASGRLPDITGVATAPLVNRFATGIPSEQQESPGLVNRLQAGDYLGVARDAAKSVLPVAARSAIDTGVLGNTEVGQALNLDGDLNYNHPGERGVGLAASWMGLNHNPESLGKELVVRKDEVAKEQYGGDYDALNREQQATVRDQLNADPTYIAAQQGRRVQAGGEENPSPIDRYFAAQDQLNTDMTDLIQAAEGEYQRTGDAVSFRKRLKDIATERRNRLDQVHNDLATASAELRGRNETVEQWLNRNLTPEDQAVNAYYDLFDQVTDKATGSLDFDRLETLQAQFLNSLPQDTRDYVERRINRAKDLTPGQQEYEGVKVLTQPYFEKRDEIFRQYGARDQFLSQFSSYSDFSKYVDEVASSYGVTHDDALNAIAMQNPTVMIIQKLIDLNNNITRMTNPDVDSALVKWYGYSPVAPQGKIDRLAGNVDLMTSGRTPDRYGVRTPKSGGFKRTRRG